MAWSKESRQSRGYGPRWDKLRIIVLNRDGGVCQQCYRANGRVHTGNEVDHIVSKAKAKRMGWTDEQIDAESNLQCINKECHRIKTEAEQGKRSKQKIGLDGFPIAPTYIERK